MISGLAATRSVTYRLLTDHLGSVRLVVDTTTDPVPNRIRQRIDYDEFGRVLTDTSPGFQPFGFAGGLYDRNTGLVRFGARDYDAVTGRWSAKDPIRFYGADPNLYGYAWNQPISLTDPIGLWGFGGIGSGSAEAGAGVGFGATGAAGLGVFGGGERGTHLGGFISGGAFAGAGRCGVSTVGVPPGGTLGAVGAFIGGGGGAFISNATEVSQLQGPFNTYSFNLGVGPIKFSVQFAESNGVWIGSVTLGPGRGVSGSTYPTTTGTKEFL